MLEITVKTILDIIPLVGGLKDQKVQLEEGSTVEELLHILISIYGKALEQRLFDESGNVNLGIAMFLNGRNIFALNGLDTTLSQEDEFLIFPPVGGG